MNARVLTSDERALVEAMPTGDARMTALLFLRLECDIETLARLYGGRPRDHLDRVRSIAHQAGWLDDNGVIKFSPEGLRKLKKIDLPHFQEAFRDADDLGEQVKAAPQRGEPATPLAREFSANGSGVPVPVHCAGVNSSVREDRSFEQCSVEQFTVSTGTVQRLTAQAEGVLMKRIEGFIARFHGAAIAAEDMTVWGGDWRLNWARKWPRELGEVLTMLEGEAEEDGWRPLKSAGAALKDEVRRRVRNGNH